MLPLLSLAPKASAWLLGYTPLRLDLPEPIKLHRTVDVVVNKDDDRSTVREDHGLARWPKIGLNQGLT